MGEVYVMKEEMIEEYQNWLGEQEKSARTVEKYSRDIRKFYVFLPEGKEVSKHQSLAWKETLGQRYEVRSMNTMLIAANGFFKYKGWDECRVKLARCQRTMFSTQEKMLSKEEYLNLVSAASEKGDRRLALIIETMCATGIRVSELSFITVESLLRGRTEIICKGKHRTIFLPGKLCKHLFKYAREQGLKTGIVFRTKNGNPLDRSNIWKNMKALCELAGVESYKVYPHNLRHLFARTFYDMEKDIAELADVLGHSSIETTRIYIATSGDEHAKKIAQLGLVV